MKTRLIFAAMLLLAFGSMKAQDTLTKAPQKSDTIIFVMPDMSQLREYMRELGVNLQRLTDSVDWKTFEQDMEQWGEEMEEWGRKMEQWGAEFEKQFEKPYNNQPLKKDDSQVHAIQVEGSGDVRVQQSQGDFSLSRGSESTSRHYVRDGVLTMGGSGDYEVVMPQLDEVIMRSSGDVLGRGLIKGKNLNLVVLGSGDLKMNVDYDTIRVRINGSGDVTLLGQCKVLYAEISGSGDLQAPQLDYDESFINTTGTGEVLTNKSKMAGYQKYNRNKQQEKKPHLLLNPHWNGFEAGLNLMSGQKISATSPISPISQGTVNLTIRPLASWYFGFNIADVGIAFNKKHTAGLFTGVGIGWNNFSWKPVYTEYDPQTGSVINTLLPDSVLVKNSNMGLLYLQVPLMVEIRPTRHMYIDLGVTGGLRFATWSKVKYADGKTLTLPMSDSPIINRFKLDASLRVGGPTFGFFINYAIVPLYKQYVMKNTRPLSFGLSINF